MLYVSFLLHFMFNIFIAIVIVLITFKPTATATCIFTLLLVSLFNFPMSCPFFPRRIFCIFKWRNIYSQDTSFKKNSNLEKSGEKNDMSTRILILSTYLYQLLIFCLDFMLFASLFLHPYLHTHRCTHSHIYILGLFCCCQTFWEKIADICFLTQEPANYFL